MRNSLYSLLVFLVLIPSNAYASDLVTIRNDSVLVKCDYMGRTSMGTGVLLTRDNKTYVLTAYHVVDNAIKAKKEKKLFAVTVIKEHYDSRNLKVGSTELGTSVIAYDAEIDVAILKIRGNPNFKINTKFYLDKKIYPLGSKIVHVGCPQGTALPMSLFFGRITYLGRKIPFSTKVKDQVNFQPIGGCSGGGVFIGKDNKCIGIVVIVAFKQGLIVPIRQILTWAKGNQLYHLFDPKAKTPPAKVKKKTLKKILGPEMFDDLFKKPKNKKKSLQRRKPNGYKKGDLRKNKKKSLKPRSRLH